jgi:alkylated DNA repair dioxygenase AlkB
MPMLFGPDIPEIAGFTYQPELISREEEQALVAAIQRLTFGTVVFRGVEARRRVAQFGWDYAFGSRTATPTDPAPEFLFPLRARAATLAGIDPLALEEVLITEYPPGAGIGWHRDAPPFGEIVGVSLVSSCRFRLKPYGEPRARIHTLELEPRSAYVLSGEVRSGWEHSIPPGKALRYSVTFRTLRPRIVS